MIQWPGIPGIRVARAAQGSTMIQLPRTRGICVARAAQGSTMIQWPRTRGICVARAAQGSTMTQLPRTPGISLGRHKHASAEDLFGRVLRGTFSHITSKIFGTAIVIANFTDSRGYTPFHVSRSEYIQYIGIGWGFRRGAPFRERISMMMQHLIEGGLIDYWLDDMHASHRKKERAKRKIKEKKGELTVENFKVDDGEVSLGLTHLQGAYYLLLLGHTLALLILLGENLVRNSNKPHHSLV
ncbi:uncharacterized protein [Panulirus ornatus]|uniref:uncharacterized protein n=1 Tax=Panulirus ornatus TaxID=150431 RepID=UPI003A863D45